jgi:hypothetical protein
MTDLERTKIVADILGHGTDGPHCALMLLGYDARLLAQAAKFVHLIGIDLAPIGLPGLAPIVGHDLSPFD